MKITFLLSSMFLGIFLMSPNSSCQPEYKNNSRVVVEGKIISQKGANIPIRLNSGDILISETKSGNDGSFKLGGPGTNQEKELTFGNKITSFSANEDSCKLSYDSLSIILPTNRSYFNISQITFEP